MAEDVIDPYLPPKRPEEKAAANVFELLDRILDKGLVIIGDIRISVADIELLKLQIRLLIASVDTAKQMGIDFSWAKAVEAPKSNDELQRQVNVLEEQLKAQQKTTEEGVGAQPSSQELPGSQTQPSGQETSKTDTQGDDTTGTGTSGPNQPGSSGQSGSQDSGL